MRRQIRTMILLGSLAALLAACGSDENRSGSKMKKDRPPSWQKMYDEHQRKAKARTLRLMESSPTYPRPPRDPAIVWKGIDSRIAMVDTKTGDYLIGQTTDRERRLSDYRFATKDDELVCIFMVQFGGGTYKKWEQFPIRVWYVEEAKRQSPAVREARKRISIKRFAEFMTAFPDFADNPSSQFVVIDAPVSTTDPL